MIERITEIINGTVEDLGFEIVKIIIRGSDIKTVEILIDRKDNGRVQVKDCREVSKIVSAMLDVEDVIPGKYFLEVSSAGIERPLVKIENFIKFTGRNAKILLHNAIEERLKYKGKIIGVNGDLIKIKTDEKEIELEYNNIKKANLIFTDDLFKELINKTQEE